MDYSKAYDKFFSKAVFTAPEVSPEGDEGSWQCNLFNQVGIGTTKPTAYKIALNRHLEAIAK